MPELAVPSSWTDAAQHHVFALDMLVSPPVWPDAQALALAATSRANGLDSRQHSLLESLVVIAARHGQGCSGSSRICAVRSAGHRLAATLPLPLPPVAALNDTVWDTENDFNRAAAFLVEALIGKDWVAPERLAVGVEELILSIRPANASLSPSFRRPVEFSLGPSRSGPRRSASRRPRHRP